MVWDDFPAKTRVIYVPLEQQVATKADVPTDLPNIGHADGQQSSRFAKTPNRTYPKWPIAGKQVNSVQTGESVASTHFATADEMWKQEIQKHLPDERERQHLKLSKTVCERDEAGAVLYDNDGKPMCESEWIADVTCDPKFPFCGALITAYVQSLNAYLTNGLKSALHDFERYQGELYQGENSPLSKEQLDEKTKSTNVRKSVFSEQLLLLDEFVKPLRILDDYDVPSTAQSKYLSNWMFERPGERVEPLREAFLKTAQRSVSDPALRTLLPDSVYELCDWQLRPRVDQSEHVMLGHSQSITNPTKGAGVRLLVLDCDYGVDFMFGSSGVVEFYIEPNDLARHDFSRAYGLTACS